MKTSDQLKAARELIEARGWWRFTDGEIHGDPYGLCIMQALVKTKGARAIRCVQKAISRNPFDWNDTPGRTKAEVIALLEALETTERAREQQSATTPVEQGTA